MNLTGPATDGTCRDRRAAAPGGPARTSPVRRGQRASGIRRRVSVDRSLLVSRLSETRESFTNGRVDGSHMRSRLPTALATPAVRGATSGGTWTAPGGCTATDGGSNGLRTASSGRAGSSGSGRSRRADADRAGSSSSRTRPPGRQGGRGTRQDGGETTRQSKLDPEVQDRLDALEADEDRSGDVAEQKRREVEEFKSGQRGVRTPLRSNPGRSDSTPSRPGTISGILDEFSKLFLLALIAVSLAVGFALSAFQVVPTPG